MSNLTIRERLIEAELWNTSDPRDPAQDIAAAFKVLDLLATRNVGVSLSFVPGDLWEAWILTETTPGRYEHMNDAYASTPARAICRAIMRHLGQRQDD